MQIKRLVIFGCGYVGRSLARELIRQGWEVWIQSRNGESLNQVEEVPPEHQVTGNLHEASWHECLTGHWDAAVNLVSSAGGGIDGYRLSYLEGNRSIRQWASQVKVDRLIYTSATSVYPQTQGEWVTEEDVPELDALSQSGRILRESELEVLGSDVFAQRVVARLAGIYGPGRHLYLDRLREGAASIPGDGSGLLNLIYMKDIVDVLIRLLTAPISAPAAVFNIVDNQPAKKQAIVDWLAAELNMESISFDPAVVGPRSKRRMAGGGLPNRRVSNGRLREALGWSPRFPDFRAGYRDLLAGMNKSSEAI